ncbi:MAG: ATP/GTP-binding protein [Euryarchaeota archaeon]|nr:ATP/GTP-binding protein [Euryarchaeota archaeon]
MEIENVFVYLLGTAGCGKTTLTQAFAEWMDDHKYRAITVNLDPGAERLPYNPDVDIRDWVELSDVMNQYGVGPNGGQILCADLMALKATEIREEIQGFKAHYILVDTPGQIELFALRETSRLLLESLGRPAFLAYLYDPLLSRQASGFASLALLALSVQFRFGVPVASFLSKADLLQPPERDRVIEWAENPERLMEALTEAGEPPTSIEMAKTLDAIGAFGTLTPLSSKTREGMEDLYNGVQQAYQAGEDIEK